MKRLLSSYTILALLHIAVVSVLGLGCSGSGDPSSTTNQSPVLSVVQGDTALTSLAATLAATPQIEDIISARGPFTILAPLNSAFGKLSPSTLAVIESNPNFRNGMLMNHILRGSFTFAQLSTMDSVQSYGQYAAKDSAKTLLPKYVHLRRSGDTLFVNDSIRIVEKDFGASNGVVHCIDGVIVR